MEVIINTVDTDNLPGYKRLLTEEYWKISDDQFGNVIDEVMEDVKFGRIEVIDIVKLFMYFCYFIEKDLIKYDMRTVKTNFINGMNVAALTSKYCDNVEEQLSQIGLTQITPDMQEILNHFELINQTLKDKMYKEKAEEIFKCIPMKMENFFAKFEAECMNIPIFKYYDVYQMFQRISCANNEDIVTIRELLMKRVNKYKKEIEPEMENIERLKQVVDNYTDGKVIGIKIVMLKEFSKDLGAILDKYKNDNSLKLEQIIKQEEHLQNKVAQEIREDDLVPLDGIDIINYVDENE